MDFLAVGHITRDRTPGGFVFGGTVSYAAATARNLRRSPAILTRGSSDGFVPRLDPDGAEPGYPANMIAAAGTGLEGIDVRLMPSPVTTMFTNIYVDGHRRQFASVRAGPILPADLPAEWAQAPIVLLGPVAQELPLNWSGQFPNSLLGITPQGWMRGFQADGRVDPIRWEPPDEFLARADAIIFSREDVNGDDDYILELAHKTRLLVVTDGYHPSTLYTGGKIRQVRARPAQEVDPTGAGDVFAAAFLTRLSECGDPADAARFAMVAASLSVEGRGLAGIPSREQVEAWLATAR